MSRWGEVSPAQRRRDGGFSLIEVIVALGLMMMVATAVLPQLLVGIRATSRSSDVTQTKGVVQGQLEKMRNLPFHVAPSEGKYVDVLDRYFPNRTAPEVSPTLPCKTGGDYVAPKKSWSGYVKAEATDSRCPYEPAGAFYRTVTQPPATAGEPESFIVTDTQFLLMASPTTSVSAVPVAPTAVDVPAGYDSASTEDDEPPAPQIGVTVTILYADHGTLRPVSTYTQIAQTYRSLRMQGKVNVTAVDIGSAASPGLNLALSAGVANINGALSQGSTVSANLAATSASLSSTSQGTGASSAVTAPPKVNAALAPALAGGLDAGCTYVCWGATRLGPIAATAEDGLPRAGSVDPLQSAVTDGTAAGLRFGNTQNTASYRTGLGLGPTLVRFDADSSEPMTATPGCGVAGGVAVAAGGSMNSTALFDPTTPLAVQTCAAAATKTISLFPTQFAPRGIVRIRLTKATASCSVSGSAHAAATNFSYAAVVSYWNGNSYVNTAVTEATGTDPLQALLPPDRPATDRGPSVSIDGSKKLGDYIESWSTLTSASITQKAEVGRAEVTLPGVVKVVTRPVRTAPTLADPSALDTTSAVSVTVGAVTCMAQDAR